MYEGIIELSEIWPIFSSQWKYRDGEYYYIFEDEGGEDHYLSFDGGVFVQMYDPNAEAGGGDGGAVEQ